jgi:hypothetical protein
LTIHSRANCFGNNESISWDLTHDYILNTRSDHYYKGVYQHSIVTGWRNTWRSAAVHWAEGFNDWKVHGRHYIAYKLGDVIPLGEEWVSDCSIYNGWWDKK